MNNKTETKKASELGQAAFNNGKDCVPAFDSELMKLLDGSKVGQSGKIISAWIEGFVNA